MIKFESQCVTAGSAYGMYCRGVKLNYVITTQEATELTDYSFKLKTSMAINSSEPLPLKLLHSDLTSCRQNCSV